LLFPVSHVIIIIIIIIIILILLLLLIIMIIVMMIMIMIIITITTTIIITTTNVKHNAEILNCTNQQQEPTALCVSLASPTLSLKSVPSRN